jgi:argonaute-like protein implicated in RNA metabolism and viral defense
MRRRTSGQRRKVEQARAVVAQALGDAARRDGPQAAKFVPTTKAPETAQPKSEAIGVLTAREAATRLGISTSEMEAMVKRGAVKSVVAGWTTMVPTSEVERLNSTTH